MLEDNKHCRLNPCSKDGYYYIVKYDAEAHNCIEKC